MIVLSHFRLLSRALAYSNRCICLHRFFFSYFPLLSIPWNPFACLHSWFFNQRKFTNIKWTHRIIQSRNQIRCRLCIYLARCMRSIQSTGIALIKNNDCFITNIWANTCVFFCMYVGECLFENAFIHLMLFGGISREMWERYHVVVVVIKFIRLKHILVLTRESWLYKLFVNAPVYFPKWYWISHYSFWNSLFLFLLSLYRFIFTFRSNQAEFALPTLFIIAFCFAFQPSLTIHIYLTSFCVTVSSWYSVAHFFFRVFFPCLRRWCLYTFANETGAFYFWLHRMYIISLLTHSFILWCQCWI